MPSTSKVDKKQPKKSKNEDDSPVIPEKKVKKSKTPKEEARRAEEEASSPRKREKKEERKKAAGGDGSVLKLGGLAQETKEGSKSAKKRQRPDEAILDLSKTVSESVKGVSTGETSKNTLGPSRSSILVGAHVLKQRKRPRGDGGPIASTSTVAKKLKLNDGGAAAVSSKSKEPSGTGGKDASEEEEIMLEDSSDEDVESDDHIHGFSTDGDSSDDDDAMAAEAPAVDVSQLLAVAKDDVTVQKRLQKAKSKPVSTSNIDYYAAYPCSYRQWIVVYST